MFSKKVELTLRSYSGINGENEEQIATEITVKEKDSTWTSRPGSIPTTGKCATKGMLYVIHHRFNTYTLRTTIYSRLCRKERCAGELSIKK
jgi:hypothetical protein